MADFKKAVWSHRISDFGQSPSDVEKHVTRLAESGFNLIIPCVKNPDGYLDFKTQIGNVRPDYPDWDPLAVLASEAKKKSLKVHPWFCVFPEGDNSALISQHADFAAKFDTESRIKWACACRDEVQDYAFSLYEELANTYEVDGLHLDYIRTGGYCRCDFCKSQMKEKGLDLDAITTRDPESELWLDWRAGRITSFVERLHSFTSEKGIELSAAVFSGYPDCFMSNAQDWVEWAHKRIVDFLFPMTYTSFTKVAAARTKQHVAMVAGACPIWEGLGKASSASTLGTEKLIEQIQAVLKEGVEGIVIFHYPALTDEDLKAIGNL